MDTDRTATADPDAAAELQRQLEERNGTAAAELDAQIAELQRQRASLAGDTTPGAGDGGHLETSLLERDAERIAQVAAVDPLNSAEHRDGEPSEAAEVEPQVPSAINAPATHLEGEPAELATIGAPPLVAAVPTPADRS